MPKTTQLSLSLTPPPKSPRKKQSPYKKARTVERSTAHRLFKLLKSNKFTQFSPEDKELLKNHYNINL